MVNFVQIASVILAGIAVGVADALIKKASVSGDFFAAFKNPWMGGVILLYLLQILFFIYVFSHGWNLSVVGNLQMVFYSLSVVGIGILLFGETLSLAQGAGIVLALVGVILINL